MAIRRWEGWHPADLSGRFWNTISKNYHLGFTSFGGPPVHFKIFHDKFVRKLQWIDEQVYQELFSVCQAFSGPGSTKMHYCINLIHDGFLPAALGFFIWSLPGALGMYGLSIGVSNIGTSLPQPVYALLSGLNASTVGIIALAAVQLSEKAITDKMTRILVFLGAAAGMLYNALWYFPLLMFLAGIVAIVHDFRWLHGPVKAVVNTLRNPGKRRRAPEEENIELPPQQETSHENTSTRRANQTEGQQGQGKDENTAQPTLPLTERAPPSAEGEPRVVPPERNLNFSWEFGLGLIVFFLITFVVIMVLRSLLPIKSLLFSFFANMYLAGTIIFGGGPVVIPLLREYVVAENWVSPRDFLIGLAIQQSFPGPNFNFAVYLGALTAINGGYNSATGAALGFVGIYAPGLITVHGTMGIWSAIRGLRWVKSLLRGVNAAAVGLIYTAVYRLWQIGYIDEGFQQGTSLGLEPWWVVVIATSYVGGYWFGVSPPVAIVMGAVLGLIWYAVVSG
ncbi:chromate transporter-domain-containing protein [Ilyonectria robusta]|uniref:chromate transporter-domain-containing protein n=1 Tax=Ilyonectria robusta TaxID=1079257 RepID=UPI001E8CBC46|nr:chromate transporter-domain-containing protein [Ilyonectria robusta]KAH8670749.1 chromate transporter-domain-containing protein [Ilyonectria robusta]